MARKGNGKKKGQLGQGAKKSESAQGHIGDQFARITAPRQLNDPEKREQWGLPRDENKRGPYIIELNLQHVGGLPGAVNQFLELLKKVSSGTDLTPVRISKTYYRCELSVLEWRQLLEHDDRRAQDLARESNARPDHHRAVFRLWPDFPVSSQTYRSVPTIKGDAAIRSFDASGRGIVWAVVDSGIRRDHPHFGENFNDASHILGGRDVKDLHRCFVPVSVVGATGREFLPDPDEEPIFNQLPSEPEQLIKHRRDLVARHREAALTDEFGHGTHVAGIIAGCAPIKNSQAAERPQANGARTRVLAYERQFKVGPNSEKVESQFTVRTLDESCRTTGVAPNCRLVSLRVLDQNGEGRSSDVIRALEYIREKINDDTRYMRVHGVNLSVGYEYDPEMFACGQSPLCAAVNRLVQSGVVVVAAAGNTGYGTVAADIRGSRVGLSNTINDPGNAAGAITVGSTHPEKPYTYGVSYFSSKGPTGDGRLKPDLVAPGERILSCAAGQKLEEAKLRVVETHWADGNDAGSPQIPSDPAAVAQCAVGRSQNPPVQPASPPSGVSSAVIPQPANICERLAEYIEDSGTSMSAPHVSGAIAAFLSIRREFIGKPEDVKRIFLENASPLGRERYFEGHGLLDLMRAIQSV